MGSGGLPPPCNLAALVERPGSHQRRKARRCRPQDSDLPVLGVLPALCDLLGSHSFAGCAQASRGAAQVEGGRNLGPYPAHASVPPSLRRDEESTVCPSVERSSECTFSPKK